MDSCQLKLDRGSEQVFVDSDEVLADSVVAPVSEVAAEEVFADVHARPRSTLAARTVLTSLVVSDFDEVLPDSDAVLPDSVEELPDSDVVLPDSVEELSDSDVVLPDSDQLDEVVHYPRCGTFHAGGIFDEACYQARREARRCARCGLLHEDYSLATMFDKMEKFDCEVYIPDVHKLQMIGDTILLLEHVIKKLDEHYNMKKLEEQKAEATGVIRSVRESSKCFG